MNKAIVIGASSGIGRALAKELGQNGYDLGLAARRLELLRKLQTEIPTKTIVKCIDISQPDQAMRLLQELIQELGGIDLIVLNSGVNTSTINLDWEGEYQTISVNVSGFAAMANVAISHFLAQNSGHLVGISSIAALRGSASCPAYSASKAFVSNYMEGLRHKVQGHNIYVTDVRPGPVDTAMIRGKSHLFWVVSVSEAVEQILQAIKRKKAVVYISRRWQMMAWLLKLLPDCLYRLRYKRERR